MLASFSHWGYCCRIPMERLTTDFTFRWTSWIVPEAVFTDFGIELYMN